MKLTTETEVIASYRLALERSKGDLSVGEVFNQWSKVVSICDSHIERRRLSMERLMSIKQAAEAKREFHRGGTTTR